MNLDHRRIGYYLTPKGLAEKTKLTLHLISWTVKHYGTLKDRIAVRLLEMQEVGVERVVFYGVSDEMEIAFVTLQGVNIKLVGIVEDDERFKPQIIFGHELEPVSRVHELKPDGILITSLNEIDKKRKRLEDIFELSSIKIKDICFS